MTTIASSVSTSSVATSTQSAITSSTASLSAAVTGSVKTDVTRALDSSGFGLFGASQAGAALIAKLGQDAVSALQSPGSQGALASVSKAITSDFGSVLNQYGMGAMAGSSQVAELVKTIASHAVSAAESTGYGQTAAPAVLSEAASPATTAAAAIAPGASVPSTSSSTAAAPAASSAQSSTVATAATAATAASTASTSTASAAAFSTDDTVASIMKALAPLMGSGTQFAAVTAKIADTLGKPRSDGQTGVILSSVADKLRSASTGTTATAPATKSGVAAAAASTTASTVANPTSSASVVSSTPTAAQAAVNTLAAIVAQTSSTASGKSALANLGVSVTKNPNLLAYAAA